MYQFESGSHIGQYRGRSFVDHVTLELAPASELNLASASSVLLCAQSSSKEKDSFISFPLGILSIKSFFKVPQV